MTNRQSRLHHGHNKPGLVRAGGILLALFAVCLITSPSIAVAGTKPDGSSCTRNTNCAGNFCVKAPGAKSGICCTQSNSGVEICDGRDNDCDATVDEGVTATFYRDQDTDSFGNPANTTQACSLPVGYVTNNADCNDTASAIRPGAPELCDSTDNNCNGQTDEGVASTFYPDQDLDTYGSATGGVQGCSAPVGYVANNTDCNDTTSAIRPGASELCDSTDNNCNGQTDEAVTSTFYPDQDLDTYGSVTGGVQGCSAPAGYVANNADCHDSDSRIHPGVTEVCDTRDNNCDGQIDEGLARTFYRDQDLDAYGNPAVTTQACRAPAGYVANNTDCDDIRVTVFPGATEICNSLDDDCDGQSDEGLTGTFYQDVDGDTFGNPAVSQTASCNAPAGYVANNTDCNDTNSAVRPGALEACNSFDDDCDTQIDEGVKKTFYRDQDSDAYGTSTNTSQACNAPSGYVTSPTDCNDTDSTVRPGVAEVCDNKDNNCNGSVDDNISPLYCAVGGACGSITACVNGVAQTCPTTVPNTQLAECVCTDGQDNDGDGTADGADTADCAPCPTACADAIEDLLSEVAGATHEQLLEDCRVDQTQLGGAVISIWAAPNEDSPVHGDRLTVGGGSCSLGRTISADNTTTTLADVPLSLPQQRACAETAAVAINAAQGSNTCTIVP